MTDSKTRHSIAESGLRCTCGPAHVLRDCSGPCEGGIGDSRNCVHCRIQNRRDAAEARSEQLYASSYGLGQ